MIAPQIQEPQCLPFNLFFFWRFVKNYFWNAQYKNTLWGSLDAFTKFFDFASQNETKISTERWLLSSSCEQQFSPTTWALSFVPPSFFSLLLTPWLLDLNVFWLHWQGSHYTFHDTEEERQNIAQQWFIYIGSKVLFFCKIISKMHTFFQNVNSGRSGRPKVLHLLDLLMFSRHNRLKYNRKNIIWKQEKKYAKLSLTQLQQNSISVCIHFWVFWKISDI